MRSAPCRELLAFLFLAAVQVLSVPAAAEPSYTFDKDPIRLGMKAIEEGRTAEAIARFDEAVAVGYQVARARYGQAKAAVLEGRYDDAEALYRQALTERAREKGSDPWPEAHAGLGLVMLRRGAEKEAAGEFDRALAEKPKLWEALYGQARLRIQEGLWNDALHLLEPGKTLSTVADGADAYHHGMALYYLGQDDVRDAETEALIAFTMNPRDPEHGTLVAEIYQKRGVPELAINAYESVLAAPGANPSPALLRNLGRLYERVERYNDARDTYLKAIAADSLYAPALHDLGRLYSRAKQHELALKVYTKSLSIDPSDVEALVGLSAAAIEARQYGVAIDAARKAVAKDSTNAEARILLARAGIESRDKEARKEAARIFLSLPDSAITRPEDLVAAATAFIDAKEYALAGRSLERALTRNPKFAEAWYQKGMLGLATSANDSAAVHFREAIRLDSSTPLYPMNLGVALLRGKHTTEAIAAFRQALAINASFTAGRVLLAQALVMADSMRAAEAEYRRVLDADPKNGPAWRGLGFCLIRKAEYREAARAYRSSTEVDPGSADGWAGLGNANLGLKDWAAAEAAFDRARRIDPDNPTLKKGMELLNNARKAASGG